MLTLYTGNDTLITLDKLRRASTGAFENSATVTFALKADSSGAPGSAVSGGTGTLSYVASSDGKYQGTLESTVSLTVGASYWLEVTMVAGGTINGLIQEPCEAKRRGKVC